MGKKYEISKNSIIEDDVEIGNYTVIGDTPRPYNNKDNKKIDLKNRRYTKTLISNGSYIGSHVIIEEGVTIGPNCIVENYSFIGSNTIVGTNSSIVYGARIFGNNRIGNDCVVGGFIAENSTIKNNCRVLGSLIHKHADPGLPWDENTEEGPTIMENVFVGIGAKVIGNITIDSFVYVCSGAIVTIDVPSRSIVRNFNEIIPLSNWPGQLKNSTFWGNNEKD